jgi:hypothetical protein
VWCGGASAAAPSFAGGPLPAAPGLGLAHNLDAEPGIAVAPDGTFWVASTTGLDQRRGAARHILPDQSNPTLTFGNSDIWRSSDGGQTYQWVADPFGPLRNEMGLAGEDTDVAVANERNAAGFYNVYVASLWALPAAVGNAPAGDIDLAISQDGGRSWLVDKLSASVPLDDRPWLAADGACTVYLAYHAGPTVATVVNKYDLCDLADTAAGATLVPVASSRYLHLLPNLAQNKRDIYVNGSFGKIVVDDSSTSRFRHRIYIPAMDCGALTATQEVNRALGNGQHCPGPTDVHVIIGTDGGRSWSLVPVATGTTMSFPIWATWLATDAAGNVYLVWWEERHVYLDVSTDGGEHWTAPLQVDQAPSDTSIFATAAGGAPGVVELAWYGTDRAAAPDNTAVMGQPGSPTSAPWYVYWARSTDGGRTFTQTAATGVIHRGAECVGGDQCNNFSNKRDLLDDFGLAISPTTTLASIAYTSDQPQGDIYHTYTGYATQQP